MLSKLLKVRTSPFGHVFVLENGFLMISFLVSTVAQNKEDLLDMIQHGAEKIIKSDSRFVLAPFLLLTRMLTNYLL